jgi:hypothetical protein
MSPLPVIACGSSNPEVFNAVKPLYLPEYESRREKPCNLVES